MDDEGQMMHILQVENLKVRYSAHEAVKGVSFSLRRGEILGIVGESGSGKSSIAKVLMNLHHDYSGDIRINSSLKPQMIFQDAAGSLNPRMKVGACIREVLRLYGSKNVEGDLKTLLKKVGLAEIVSEQYPREISGGQSQRVSIARALAANTDLLIADEPVSALDVSVQARILNLLRDLNKDTGLSIILIAHDLAVVKNICDDVVVMHEGLVAESGKSAEVLSDPKSEYTKTLLRAVPGQRLFQQK